MIPPIRFELKALQDSVVFNDAEWRRILSGPIMDDLIRRGIRVMNSAKRHASGRPGPNVITGTLRDSIMYRPGSDEFSPYVDVGSGVHYAPMVELGHGNVAHIYPIYTPGGSFTGRFGFVGNRRTPAYPFLRPALEAARTT